KLPVGKDEAQVLFGYNRFVDNLDTKEHGSIETLVPGGGPDDTEILDPFALGLTDIEHVDTKDQDWFGTLAYTANVSSLVSVKVGVDGRIKTRDYKQTVFEVDFGEDPELDDE